MSHTKEPWFVGFGDGLVGDRIAASCYWDSTKVDYIPVSHNKNAVCLIAGDTENNESMISDARRIVACVNACANIDTGLLEAADTGFFQRQSANFTKIKTQRDVLLSALKDVLERMERPPEPNCSCHLSPPCNDCVEHAGIRESIEFANSVIKKDES